MKTTKITWAAVVAMLTLSGCSAAPTVSPASPSYATPASPPVASSPSPSVTLPPIRLAVAGDSITSWDNYTFPNGDLADVTWLRWMLATGDYALAGGWSYAGASSAAIDESMPAVDCDVLVIMAGTNDVGQRSPDAVATHIFNIVVTSGAPAVVVSAIAPRDDHPQEAAAINARLKTFAAEMGWTYVDPWTTVATTDRLNWLPGYTLDGVHPTAESAQVAEVAIDEAIRATLGR